MVELDSPIKPSDRIIKVNEIDDTFWGHRKDTYVFREVEYILTAQKYVLPKEVNYYRVTLDSVGYVIDTHGNITRDLSQAFVFKTEVVVCIQECEKHEPKQFCWAGEYNQINFCKNGLAISSYPKDKAQQWLDNHPLPRKGISKMTRGNVYSRFNATADLLELKMIEGGLYFTTPDRDCFTPNLDLNENAQIDNWQLLHYTGEKLGTLISDIHITKLEIFDKPKEISEFNVMREYTNCGRCPHALEFGCSSNGWCRTIKPLTRAPQSYCFIEI